MQNKRGISQAFARPLSGLEIRPASVFDVFAMSQVLTASVRGLCQAGHGCDPQRIDAWTAAVAPGQIRAWFGGAGRYWLAERNGQAAAVGGLDPDGTVTLLYVAPSAAGQGTGSALLAHLEAELHSAGHSEGRLSATRAALGFCRKHGWRQEEASAASCCLPCIPMRKPLG